MCWRHVATRLVNRKSTEHKMARLVFGFSPESSVGFGRFFAAVGCKAKPTEKHRVEPVFRFRCFWATEKPTQKSRFSVST